MTPSTLHCPSFATPLAELEAREASIAKNLEGLENSTKQEAIAEGLILIKDKKLYKAAGFKSFKTYLDARRNRISRPRAYQLINFLKHKRACIKAGLPIPRNERQSRAAQAGGGELAPFEQRWAGIFKYLKMRFLACPPFEREKLAELLELAGQCFSRWAERLKADQKTDAKQESPSP